jgi:SAM-dependent methyltransferase
VSEPTICISCGQANWQPHLAAVLDYLTDERFDIDQCANCSLRITRPMPPPDEIGKYYPPRYRGNRHGFTGKMRVALRRRAVESFFPKGFRGRLLDVGCGDGAFVLEMNRRGWDVCATEIDAATVDRLRAANVDAKVPSVAERDGFDSPFDAVTCWHVLEHVEHPDQVARWVATQLKPSGIFQATVPDVASLQARLFGRYWLHLDVPRHLYHFTAGTLKPILQSAGFSPVHQSCFALEYDWFGVIQSALNMVCSRPNELFEHLTGATPNAATASHYASISNAVISYSLCAPAAMISLPAILLAWAGGNGATLTITSRLRAPVPSTGTPGEG